MELNVYLIMEVNLQYDFHFLFLQINYPNLTL
nr:MAG TPA: hypothetical protein [Caudoviricetes sp.]